MARTYKPVSAGTLSARKAEKGAADMPRVGPPQLHKYIYIHIQLYMFITLCVLFPLFLLGGVVQNAWVCDVQLGFESRSGRFDSL